LQDALRWNVEYLLAEVSDLDPAPRRVVATRPFSERIEVGDIRIAVGQLILRLVPPAAGTAFGPRALTGLDADSTVRRSTPGARSPMLRARSSERSDRSVRDPGGV